MTTARGRSGTGDPGPAARPSVASRVLLVEDEPGLLRALFINLRARRYDVITASTGHEALATAANRPPDAVILDLGLPDIDGTEVIVELRRWSRAPIIVLSGRANPGDKIGALDVGADDYVTKPFSMAELLARLRAVLRRDDPGPAGVTEAVVGHCVIDLTTHTVTRRPDRGTEAGAQHAARTEAGPAEAGPEGGRNGPAHPDRMADPGDPGPPSGPAGGLTAAAYRHLGTRLRAAHQLPPVPHGPAAPQAGRRPGAAPSPAHRAGHGLPVPAVRAARGGRSPGTGGRGLRLRRAGAPDRATEPRAGSAVQ